FASVASCVLALAPAPPIILYPAASGRGAAWLARPSGGRKVASSNLAGPTKSETPTPIPGWAFADGGTSDERNRRAGRPGDPRHDRRRRDRGRSARDGRAGAAREPRPEARRGGLPGARLLPRRQGPARRRPHRRVR